MNIISALEQTNVHRQKTYGIYIKTTAMTQNEYFDIIAIE
jgi:hypothetical protein